MIGQQKPRELAGYRGEAACRNKQPQFIKPKPAFGNFFAPGDNGAVRVIVGWPLRRPPAANIVCLPPGTDPKTIDWGRLRGFHVLVAPPAGTLADHQLLRELGAELVAAGAASLVLFDGEAVAAEFWRAAEDRPGAAL